MFPNELNDPKVEAQLNTLFEKLDKPNIQEREREVFKYDPLSAKDIQKLSLGKPPEGKKGVVSFYSEFKNYLSSGYQSLVIGEKLIS